MNKLFRRLTNRSRVNMRLNVGYEIRDKNGNIKPIFQENYLGRYLMKKGLVSPLWINNWYAFLLLPFMGYWSNNRLISNIITNTGMAGIASRLNGAGGEAVFTWIGLGTGVAAAVATDTALGAEITTGGLARANSTASRVTTTVTNDTAQNQHSFNATASFAVTESGVFNAGAGGVMCARQVYTVVNVVNGDVFQVTWRLRVS